MSSRRLQPQRWHTTHRRTIIFVGPFVTVCVGAAQTNSCLGGWSRRKLQMSLRAKLCIRERGLIEARLELFLKLLLSSYSALPWIETSTPTPLDSCTSMIEATMAAACSWRSLSSAWARALAGVGTRAKARALMARCSSRYFNWAACARRIRFSNLYIGSVVAKSAVLARRLARVARLAERLPIALSQNSSVFPQRTM